MTRSQAAADESSWSTVQDEKQVKFETDGEVFTGVFLALDRVGTVPQAHFTGTGQYAGADYFTNCGRDLQRKLAKVPLGSETRITRTGSFDTGQSSPMITYSVEHRRH